MVEWKKLGEVANLVRGKVISKDFIRDNGGEYPVYSSQTANNGLMGCINSYMFNGEYLTWTTDGAYAGTIFRRKGKFNITNVCGLIDIKDENLNQDFLYYWLALTAKAYVLEGMGNPKLMSNVACNIRIPIIPILKQKHIVEILDTFTSSIDNLKQQIAQRRKQYEYYRDKLIELTSKEWPSATLKDVATIKNGKDYKNLLKGNIPVYGSGGIMTYVDEYASEKPSVLLPRKGSVENIFYVENPFWTVDTIYWTEIDTSKVLPKFLFYSLLKYNLKDFAYGGARPSLSQPILYKLEIPLPSLVEQQRIVDILDKFESCIQNLEAQLSQREKQYEYYRNKLLTFE